MVDPSFPCELCHYSMVCRCAEVLQVAIWGTGHEKGQALTLDLCEVVDIITMTATVLAKLVEPGFFAATSLWGTYPISCLGMENRGGESIRWG